MDRKLNKLLHYLYSGLVPFSVTHQNCVLFEFVIALVYLFLLITGFPPSLPVLPTFIISIWFREKKTQTHIPNVCFEMRCRQR